MIQLGGRDAVSPRFYGMAEVTAKVEVDGKWAV